MVNKITQPLVSIPLCTFNGEVFLAKQLDSLINQTYSNIEILIFDDKSNDYTLSIIQEYATKNNKIRYFQNQENIGYIKNFEKAFTICKGYFIAPCDQDDIWEKNKIEYLVANFQEDDTLIYHNSKYINEEGYEIGKTSSQIPGFIEGKDKFLVAYNNCVPGHAMFFKSEFLNKVFPLPADIPYDHWIAFIALSIGKIRFIREPLVKHRLHKNSTTFILNKKLEEENNNKRKKILNKLFVEQHRIEALLTMKSSIYNSNLDIQFYENLIYLLKTKNSSYFCFPLFFTLFKNRKSLFKYYRKSPLSILLRIFNYSKGINMKKYL